MGAFIACSQCGQPLNDFQKTSEFTKSTQQISSLPPFSPSDAVIYASNHESNLLCQEISRIDDTIRQLYEERATRCRRLNEIQSPAAKLPSHILSSIFELTYPPKDYNSTHQRVRRLNAKPLSLPIFALCAVSSRWRDLILSSPQFWAKLDWYWKYQLSSEDTTDLLRTYFARAAPLPFDLKLTIDEKWEIENTIAFTDPVLLGAHLDALKNTIFMVDGPERIGSLKLDAPNKWLHLLSNRFSHLSELSLSSGRIDTIVDLSFLPCLTKVTFKHLKAMPALPWRQITAIDLVYANINIALRLLKRCTQLVEFHNRHPHSVKNPSIVSSPILKSSVTLDRLKWLDWSCVGSPFDEALFHHLHLPSLNRLTLSGDVSWNSNWSSTLTKWLTRLPTAPPIGLLELGFIHDSGGPVPVLKTIFTVLGSRLNSLTILEDDHPFLENVTTLLTPSSSSAHNTIFLPALKTLRVKSPDPRTTSNENVRKDNGVFTRLRGAPQELPAITNGGVFVEFLKQRWKVLHLDGVFVLDLGFGNDVVGKWRAKGKEEVRRLVEEGFELVLCEMGERVDWLPEVKV